jgi:hypothetical protein
MSIMDFFPMDIRDKKMIGPGPIIPNLYLLSGHYLLSLLCINA